MIIPLSGAALDHLLHVCSACRFHRRTGGVLCLRHTLSSEHVARAKAIGVVR